MRRAYAVAWMLGAIGCGAGALAAGCVFDTPIDCENALVDCPGGTGGGGGGTPAGCVPSENDEAVGDACGVFVSSSLGDDANEGTQGAPVKTLGEAVARAAERGARVYACAETFDEAVEVPAGATLFGGLDCAAGWIWAGETKKTAVAPAMGGAIPLRLLGGEGTTRIEDVAAMAPDAVAAGGSSIAVLADGATAELVRCELTAGDGAEGEAGADAPAEAPMQAPSGNDGANACSDLDGMPGPDATLQGGAQVVNDCGGGELSIGGTGGTGNITNGDTGQAGQVGALGAPGAGEPVMGAWSCAADGTGQGGDSGTPGEPGPGATGLGTLTSSTSSYAGVSGGPGTAGTPGQGGGGGGGAKGGAVICPGAVAGAGASGGSGGAGGCGGQPGQGAGPGGASIALASVGATVTLTDCTLTAGRGGNGGRGGNAQPGAAGGQGGLGGQTGGVVGVKAACAGGQGGQGGDGGPGGGGLGGPSVVIAFVGAPVTQGGMTSLTPGTGGTGGPGGSNGVGMNAGANGLAATEQEFP